MSPFSLRRFGRFVVLLLVAVTSVLLTSVPLVAQKPSAQKKENEAVKRQYNVALGFERRNLYPDAVILWQKFLQNFPNDSRVSHAKYHLGICRFQQKKFVEAAKTFRGVFLQYPKFEHCDAARFNLGLSLYNLAAGTKKAADYSKAAAAFDDVVKKHPTSKLGVNCFYYRAECAFQTGDKPAAVAIYQQAIQKYPAGPLLAEIHYALGTTQQELKQFPAAAATFQTFLRKFPQDIRVNECRLRRGIAMMSMKKIAPAEKIFTQLAVLKTFKLADYALLKQAECVLQRGNVTQAVNLYQSLPRRFPKSAYIGAALIAAGKNRFQSGQYPPAQRLFTDVISRQLDEADEAAYWLARTQIQLKNPAAAMETVRKAIAANPKSLFLPHLELTRIDAAAAQPKLRKSAVALYAAFAKTRAVHPLAAESQFRAASLSLQGEDFPAAISHAAVFLATAQFAKSPYRPRVLFIAGEAYLLREKPDAVRALASYRQLIDGFPQDAQLAQARLRLGFCLYRTGKPTEAVKVLTTAFAQLKEPDQLAEAQLLIGRCHADGSRHKQAVAAFAAAAKAGPQWKRSDEVHYLAGVSQLALKQTAAAVAEFNKVVRKSPHGPYRANAHLQLAEIAFAVKKFAVALTNFTAVIKTFPKTEAALTAHYGSASVFYAQGNDAKAVSQLSTLLKQQPKSGNAASARYLRGLCYRRMKKFPLAVKDLTDFLAGQVGSSEAENARYALALCHIGMKKYPPAITSLTALLKSNPKFPDADHARYELGFAYLQTKAEGKAAETFRQLIAAHPASPLVAECWMRIGTHYENNKQPAQAAKAFAAGVAKARKPQLQERLRYRLGWGFDPQADY
ncbi:MAG: tetratricopeptide repeat protein, partial [Planctomycetes bacterium]|nr:tetratricopeptide repeat protein [Planctomycetota bacterium]